MRTQYPEIIERFNEFINRHIDPEELANALERLAVDISVYSLRDKELGCPFEQRADDLYFVHEMKNILRKKD